MKKVFVYIFLLFVVITSCKQVRKVSDVITQPTAREVYARDFDKDDSVYNEWNSAFAKAYSEPRKESASTLQLSLPHTTVGTFSQSSLKPYQYHFKLSQGETFVAETKTGTDTTKIFLDLFKWKNDSIINETPVVSNEEDGKSLSLDIKESGNFTLLIQPEIETRSNFKTRIFTQPSYTFPVSGKRNKAVQSFWGAPRGGGKRSHKGIDIFAPRGTPVIAITNGIVSSTSNRGLGGKQVWLRDGLFGKSLYYAHLDSIMARTGQRVKVGDTLGLVGNTGNARTTPPHLHFGIYGRGGAVNPYPFVQYRAIPEHKDSLSAVSGVIKNTANVRKLPKSKGEKITQLKRKDTVSILERTGNWYRARYNDTITGYVYTSSIRLLKSN